ncbi:hypothetical protein JTB14_020461 [Gonioctena quinquepunctata]|nr:hypothetical protein JTB14_020461 [Gonioctena quinquepunctata]
MGKHYIRENKLDHILLDPSRIFNGDEAGFQLCPKSGKVFGPEKSKEDFYERVSSEKEQITVMATFSVNGKVVPPMPKSIVESVPEQWALDGHKSHLTQQVSQLCDDHGIVLMSLFPNSTHIMQPADVAVFKALKSGWTTAVRGWKFENFPKEVIRYSMGRILKFVFDQYAKITPLRMSFDSVAYTPGIKPRWIIPNAFRIDKLLNM